MKKTKNQQRLEALGRWATLLFIIVAVVLIALEFLLYRHGEIEAENRVLFPAIFGFVVFVGIVFGGIMLRKLVMRKENYYGDN